MRCVMRPAIEIRAALFDSGDEPMVARRGSPRQVAISPSDSTPASPNLISPDTSLNSRLRAGTRTLVPAIVTPPPTEARIPSGSNRRLRPKSTVLSPRTVQPSNAEANRRRSGLSVRNRMTSPLEPSTLPRTSTAGASARRSRTTTEPVRTLESRIRPASTCTSSRPPSCHCRRPVASTISGQPRA